MKEAVEIELTVPGLLTDCVGGQRTVSLRGATLGEAIRVMNDTYPRLAGHLYRENGQLRPHVLLFYNEDNVKVIPDLNIELKPGDRLQILQAVSGG
jgi:sulfur-carrier protein